jgi:Predicted nucleotide-binding protein containing TIR-like domain
MELSSELRQRCKEVFETCNQFDSNDQLRDLMAVTSLKPFRSEVEASTKSERITRCLARLPEKKWNDQEVFLCFVHELRQQYREGDGRRQTLNLLFNNLQNSSNLTSVAFPGKALMLAPQNTQQSLAVESDQSKRVLIIYSQNEAARIEISEFLKGANLIPVEWKQIEIHLEKSGPSIDEVLSVAFDKVQAVMVVLTGDDLVEPGREFVDERNPGRVKAARFQPVPDLLFKAGVAFGMKSTRTVLVALGKVRPLHSLLERHLIRLTDSYEDRKEVITKLQQAHCLITGYEWSVKGNFQNLAFF